MSCDQGCRSSRAKNPNTLTKARQVMNYLRSLPASDIMEWMKVNSKIANQNYERFLLWNQDQVVERCDAPNMKLREAIWSFTGEVFHGLDADSLTEDRYDSAEAHFRILSALYGALSPFDLIMEYRLDMGLSFKNRELSNIKSFYNFWKDDITEQLNQAVKEHNHTYILNLASNEYFKAVDRSKLSVPVISPQFKQQKGDKLKTIVIYTKKARGFMARYVIDNNIRDYSDLLYFDVDGYRYEPSLSTEESPVFIR